MVGERGGQAQTEMINYPFHPVLIGNESHLITTDLTEINLFFPTVLDTVFTSAMIKKTPLIVSSDYSKKVKYPYIFSFESLRDEPEVDSYNENQLAASILVEGKFDSYFKNRLSTSQLEENKAKGFIYEANDLSAQIVITEQQQLMPELGRTGRPFPIGFNKWERSVFKDNQLFIENALEYLINGNEFLLPDERSAFKLASLDKQKVSKEGGFWRLLNMCFPVVFVMLLHFLYSFYLKRRYA